MGRIIAWFRNLSPIKAMALTLSVTFIIFLFATLLPTLAQNKSEIKTVDKKSQTEEQKTTNDTNKLQVQPQQQASTPVTAPTLQPVSVTSPVLVAKPQMVRTRIIKKITTVTTYVASSGIKTIKVATKIVSNTKTVANPAIPTAISPTPVIPTTPTPVPITPTNTRCTVGKITIKNNNKPAPATITIAVSNVKNVSFYQWSLGDDSASIYSNKPTITHSYKSQGNYKITLKAYASEASFRKDETCFSKNFTVTVKKKEASKEKGWLWPTTGRITSVVGMRHQPVTGEWRMHQGIDIANKKGTTIVAARDGLVVATNSSCHTTKSNCGGGYGNYVVIRHSNGLYSIYAHLSKVNTRVGTKESAGHKIGEMGNTGLTKETHLHFGIGYSIWVNGRILNPLKVLPTR